MFWKRRFHSRKTSVVLINLSVADLMVGVSSVEDIIRYICLLSKASCGKDWTTKYFILGEFSGCASISFLVLVSLERLYAIVWPFRSRTTSSRTYMIAVGIVWLLSGATPALALLSKSSEILPVEVYEWFGSVIMIACPLTVSCAYALIWFYSKRKDPRLSQNNHKRNKNLAKTLFIVTVSSFSNNLATFCCRFQLQLYHRKQQCNKPSYSMSPVRKFIHQSNCLFLENASV